MEILEKWKRGTQNCKYSTNHYFPTDKPIRDFCTKRLHNEFSKVFCVCCRVHPHWRIFCWSDCFWVRDGLSTRLVGCILPSKKRIMTDASVTFVRHVKKILGISLTSWNLKKTKTVMDTTITVSCLVFANSQFALLARILCFTPDAWS